MSLKKDFYHLSCPLQRAAIRSYLSHNFWIYLAFSAIHLISVVKSRRLGATSQIYTNIGFAACFLIGAIRSKKTEKQLFQPKLSNTEFKKSVEGIMWLNWVIISINLVGFAFMLVLLVFISMSGKAGGQGYGIWPLAAAAQILVLIPFLFQVTKHKALNQDLVGLMSAGKSVANQISFSDGLSEGSPCDGFNKATQL